MKFRCYCPDDGETVEGARDVEGFDVRDAAEAFAEQRCHHKVEYPPSLTVIVLDGAFTHTYEVVIRPSFVARQKR